MKHYGKKRDANHAKMVEHLKAVGVSVIEWESTLDLITHYRSNTVIWDIKIEGDACIKLSQMKLFARWTGYCGYARTFEEGENLSKRPERYALTQAQKDRIGIFLRTFTGKEMRLKKFEKEVLGIG